MASTDAPSALPSAFANATDATAGEPPCDKEYHTVLLVVYSVVLLCGGVSLSLMMHALKSSSASATSIAVLNLIFAHFVFLLTVPFRLYYYATGHWGLGEECCKLVSSMIHIHMYMSFVLYGIILLTRLLTFYNKATHMACIQRIHAFIVSALVWTVVLVLVPLVVRLSYGKDGPGTEAGPEPGAANCTGVCFKFGKQIEFYKELNYAASVFVIAVAVALTALQANVLRVLYRKHRERCSFQQEFGAQLKSLCFALIMVLCFIPYHLFRLYYLENVDRMENVNEVFLSVTTFNCLDMLTFLGRRTCYLCSPVG